MILLCKALYRAFAVFVQSSLQVVCHAGVQDSISFVGQKVDIILFHALTAFLGVEFAEAFLLSERVLRVCLVASLLAMTNRGASTVLTAASTDRGCLPEIATSASGLLAMTSRGCMPFYDGSFRTAVPSRDCHVASLLAMTNRGCMPSLRWLVLNGSTYLRLPRRFAPRNDKSGGRYDQLNLPRILRFPPYWKSPQRR